MHAVFHHLQQLTDTIRNKFLDWDQRKQSTKFKVQFIIVSGIDDHTKQATGEHVGWGRVPRPCFRSTCRYCLHVQERVDCKI